MPKPVNKMATSPLRGSRLCAAPGAARSPIRKWINAIVTQAPIATGDATVIQVISDFPQDGLPRQIALPSCKEVQKQRPVLQGYSW
jgi:hypothetical protein